MSKVDRTKHYNFLKKEWMLQQIEFQKKLDALAIELRERGELYLSQYAGVDEKRGMLILKFFSSRPIPRKNEHLIAFIPQTQHLNPSSWIGKPYKEIRRNPHRLTELKSVWIKKDKERNDRYIIGFSGAELSFLDGIALNTPVILGPEEPPLEYFQNLMHLVKSENETSKFEEIINVHISEPKWRPNPLTNDVTAVQKISNDLFTNDDVIIQGPPGTGKTFLMASLCAYWITQGKRILVTALTNRALAEFASKEGLKSPLIKGLIFKLNLSSDEKMKLPGIQNGMDYSGTPGSILLATYYAMSGMALNSSGKEKFDIVLIEEASQAFLSTIAAARKLAAKCLIIGDQKQLQPIVSQQLDDSDEYKLKYAVNGLSTVCNCFTTATPYILSETFRLNEHATKLTNVFYEEATLVSTKKEEKHVIIPDITKAYFPNKKGVKLNLLDFSPQAKAPLKELNLISQIIIELHKANPGLELAVLSFYKETVKELQKIIYPETKNAETVLVETIDRVQGMTAHVCIYFVPFVGFNWSLQPNRFNVATSRAQEYTLIFTHPQVRNYKQMPATVKDYFALLLGET
jgi:DNA replication ATP-dependent helicase Dna2